MAKHKLVAVGDSLTQGFASGAIHRTDISFPAMLADALDARDQFIVPSFHGEGGLPLNLELILRTLADTFGTRIDWWEAVPLLYTLQQQMDRVEDYWERGRGSQPVPSKTYHHNLAVWGFGVEDALIVDEANASKSIGVPRDNWTRQIPEQSQNRTARRVLNPSYEEVFATKTQMSWVEKLSQDGGIENIVVFLGANNALGTVTSLSIVYSEPDDLFKLPHERRCNLYHPEHFRVLYTDLAERLERVAREQSRDDVRPNIFVGTIPRVTIPPVTRGVNYNGRQDANGYFEYYTRPWIWDEDFDPDRHPHLTRNQVKKIDKYTSAYNKIIKEFAANNGWHVFDVERLMNDLAYRRRGGEPQNNAFPSQLVDALKNNGRLEYLVRGDRVLLDTRFMNTDNDQPERLAEGGLFSLDGIHPTTIGYALLANLVHQSMKKAGVSVKDLNWDEIVQMDTLVNRPPVMLAHLRSTLGMLDRRGLLSGILKLF